MIDSILPRYRVGHHLPRGETLLCLRCDWCRREIGALDLHGGSHLDTGAGYVPQKLGFTTLDGDGNQVFGFLCQQTRYSKCASSRAVALACSDACEDQILVHPAFPDNLDYHPAEWGTEFRDADIRISHVEEGSTE
jgi:hypothetical protein